MFSRSHLGLLHYATLLGILFCALFGDYLKKRSVRYILNPNEALDIVRKDYSGRAARAKITLFARRDEKPARSGGVSLPPARV